jgi:acyl carrier protein
MITIDSRLLSVISRELEVDEGCLNFESGPESDLLEWDSFSHVILILAIEKEFQTLFNASDFSNLGSIKKIQTVLQNKDLL